MKSTVTTLSPTRVRLSVDLSASELKKDFEKVYKELAERVRVPGFRPGKAPAKVIDTHLGKQEVVQRVLNAVIPARYNQAIAEAALHPLGQPHVNITTEGFTSGSKLEFVAEVDVRPELTLPDFASVTVTVDPVEPVTEEEIDEELDRLRDRFATLKEVDRPAADGDVLSIDLSAELDGQQLLDAATKGLLYQVGSTQLIEGLDQAVCGLSAGETTTFTTKLLAGPHRGREAQVTVTVHQVKERELPEVDDEFAQLASSHDTVEELRQALGKQVERAKRLRQAENIHKKLLELLIDQIEIPLPEELLQANIQEALQRVNDPAQQETIEESARKLLKTQILLDTIADALQVTVSQQRFAQHIAMMASQYGLSPQDFLQRLPQQQVFAIYAKVRQELALGQVATKVAVVDTNGTSIDLAQLLAAEFGTPAQQDHPTLEQPAESIQETSSDDSSPQDTPEDSKEQTGTTEENPAEAVSETTSDDDQPETKPRKTRAKTSRTPKSASRTRSSATKTDTTNPDSPETE